MNTRRFAAQSFLQNNRMFSSPTGWFAPTIASPDVMSPNPPMFRSDEEEEDACSMCSSSSDSWDCEHLVPVVHLGTTRRSNHTDSALRGQHELQQVSEGDAATHSAMVDVVHRSLALTSHISITAGGPLDNTMSTLTRQLSGYTAPDEECYHSCPAHLGAYWQPLQGCGILQESVDRLNLHNRAHTTQHTGGYIPATAPQSSLQSRQRHMVENWVSTLSPQHCSPIPEVIPVTTAVAVHGQQGPRSLSTITTAGATPGAPVDGRPGV